MKILVFSDSHGETASMFAVMEAEAPDLVIHLGDNLKDGLALGPQTLCVKGNCDWGEAHSDQETFELCGRKIFITHGHLYGVKNGLNRIAFKGMEIGADLVLFGHTHRAFIAKSGNTWLFNPGTIGGRSRDLVKSYGLVHLGEDGIRCEPKRVMK
jgi:hypothetical protein